MNELEFARQIKDNFSELGKYLKEQLTEELIQQGHKYTGALIKSIDYAVELYQKELVLSLSYYQYGAYLNKGVKANKVPFGKGNSSSKQSEYLRALTDWVIGKRIETRAKQAFGVAIAIAKTHAKKGIPTVGSFKYSLNGRRLGFQDYILSTKEREINEIIQSGLERSVFTTLDNILKQAA